MKCPRCGAENAEEVQCCYLCELPFGGAAEAGDAPPGEGTIPLEPAADAPEPGVTTPPPVPRLQPPPPEAAPPPFRPTAGGKSASPAKIGVAVTIVLVVIVAGLLSFFLLRGKTYSINVPIPPGYTRADEKMVERARKSFKDADTGIVLEEMFIDETNTNFVFVIHQDVPFSDVPSGKDPEEMERYFYDHKDEWSEAFNSGIMEAGEGLDPRLERYEVLRMASGDAALHMTTSLDIQQYSFAIETLWIIKGSSAFAIVIEGLDPNGAEAVDFFIQNITFE